jgi:hypothetical protein
VQQELGISDEQDHEAPEQQGVVYAETVASGDSAALGERIIQHVLYAFTNAIEAVLGPAQRYQTETAETAIGEEHHSAHEDYDEYDDLRRHGLSLFSHHRFYILSKLCWRSVP